MENTLIERLGRRVAGSSIHMGTSNGWDSEDRNLMRELRPLEIQGTRRSRYLGRCYRTESFDVKINETTYTVQYSEDSSD